jgi:hypothetical protein
MEEKKKKRIKEKNKNEMEKRRWYSLLRGRKV